MTRTIVPPIKCQGIKTKLVPWIKAILPTIHCGRWIEPFMGSGVVAFNVRPEKALLCDSNPHLINFYRAIASGEITPNVTRKFLTEEGKKLCESDGEYYYKVRERFNEKGAPLDFLFLNRSCFNGMIRFNRKGGFNVPFCRKPTRFAQAYVTKITNQVRAVAEICDSTEFEFRCQTFSETLAEASGNDLIYADPPYIDRHTDYFNGWNEENERDLARLFAESNSQFILSTWHSNQYRANQFLDSIWSGYNMLTREHFYHVGAQEKNRNPMLEALVTNFEASITELEVTGPSQRSLFD